MSSKLRVGVAGPVGSGKTALVETLCLNLKKNYEIAANYALFDIDYAIYNRSVCLGLFGKSSGKVKLLKQLEENYKQSAY